MKNYSLQVIVTLQLYNVRNHICCSGSVDKTYSCLQNTLLSFTNFVVHSDTMQYTDLLRKTTTIISETQKMEYRIPDHLKAKGGASKKSRIYDHK